MKAEYNLNTMKRKGHPLREKVSRDEIKLLSSSDIPDRDSKLANLTLDEREVISGMLEFDYIAKKERKLKNVVR